MALGERAAELDLTCVATSDRTHVLATDLGLRVVSPDEARRLDIAIDGADEVDPGANLTKGGGGAHTREKIVATMADRFVVVVDETKLVPALGPFGTPLEVLDFAPGVLTDALTALGAVRVVSEIDRRTDNGNLLMRAFFPPIADPAGLAAALAALPGVVEHGLFLGSIVDDVYVAGTGGVRHLPGGRNR
jgi:ribose 5-phosphate isomerase A